MRVLLVNPPAGKVFIREGRCMNRQSTWDSIWPPLTLMYISSSLKKRGHTTLILDSNVLGAGEIERTAKEFSPELAIVNTATPTIAKDLEFCSLLKNLTSSKTAVIGVHPTSLFPEILSEAKNVDFVIRGEPEETSADLADAIERRTKLEKVRGIAFLKKGKLVANKERAFVSNLDSLPAPDREGIDNSLYKMPFSRETFTIINPSRGCPYNCTFCTASIFYGKRFRKRSPESIVSEISECISKYNIRTFLFWSDEFTLDKKYVISLCKELKEKCPGIKWFTNSRVDTCDYSLFSEMKAAGCFLISFGIESASQNVLNIAKKGTTVEMAKKAVSSAKKAGLETIGHFILGLAGETRESAEATIEFSKSLGLDYAQFYIATPYPGTPFYNYCVKEGLIEKSSFSEMEISNAAIRQGELSSEDLVKLRRKAYRSFYSRPLFALSKAVSIFSKGGLFGIASALAHLSDWGELGK